MIDIVPRWQATSPAAWNFAAIPDTVARRTLSIWARNSCVSVQES